MMTLEPDHYAVLELEPGSPVEAVKSQYRRLAKRYHPDLNNNDAACQEHLRRVIISYRFLSDAPRKAAYDACLQESWRKPGASRPAPRQASARPQAPPVAPASHARTLAEVRMTRSGWLAATAAVILVLLVAGLSLDSMDNRRPARVESTSPAALESVQASVPGPKRDLNSAPVPFAASGAGARLARSPLPTAPSATASSSFSPRVGSTGPLGKPWPAVPKTLLLPYPARPLRQGSAFRTAGLDTESEARRLQSDLLALERARTPVPRVRLRPAASPLPRQNASAGPLPENAPVPAGFRRSLSVRRSLRSDTKVFPAAAFRFEPSLSAVPKAPVPGVGGPPAAPAPRAASAASSAAPSETPKPKASAPSSQGFIMWGN